MPTEFTPWTALAGGALIGLAATVLLASLGRIAGISGLFNGALEQRGDRAWRIAFLVGLVAAAGVWFAVAGVAPRTGFPLPWLLVGGLLVGFGTRLGSGCTSGHGISGALQLSVGSWIALAAFFAGGVATAALMYG